MLQSPHTDESAIISGAKGIAGAEHDPESLHGVGGAGAFLEATLIHDRLELELGVVATSPGASWHLAFEPLLKLPLHVAERFDAYLATGPVLLHAARSGPWRGGPQVVAGTYVWLHERAGFDLDLSLAALFGGETTVELSAGLGPVVRF